MASQEPPAATESLETAFVKFRRGRTQYWATVDSGQTHADNDSVGDVAGRFTEDELEERSTFSGLLIRTVQDGIIAVVQILLD
jgi:hypothetical protein